MVLKWTADSQQRGTASMDYQIKESDVLLPQFSMQPDNLVIHEDLPGCDTRAVIQELVSCFAAVIP